jgi:hypothetical protein
VPEFDVNAFDAGFGGGVEDAVAVEVGEDEVTDGHPGSEAEVDGGVEEVIVGVVIGTEETGFLGADGGLGGGKGDDGASDAVEVGLRLVDAIFAEVIVAVDGAGEAEEAEERGGFDELGVGDVNVVEAGAEVIEGVAAEFIGGGGGEREVPAGQRAVGVEFDLDGGDTFAGIGTVVAVEVDEDEVAEADGLVEAEVEGEVVVAIGESVEVGAFTELAGVVGGFGAEGEVEGGGAGGGV